jgi:hypothetical protein
MIFNYLVLLDKAEITNHTIAGYALKPIICIKKIYNSTQEKSWQ